MRKKYLLLGLLSFAVGCSSKKDDKPTGDSAFAKVALDDAAVSIAGTGGGLTSQSNTCISGNTCASVSQISKFEIKIMGVGIHTMADTTQGYGSAIYSNPACPAPELSTEIDGKMYRYVGFGSCSDASITDYVDLKSSTVSSDLNSQFLPMAPGTYKFGQLTFCMGGAQSNNYRVTLSNDSGLPAELRGGVIEAAIDTCGVTTPEMNPAMVVADGQAVVVTLQYDLVNTVYYRPLSNGESASSGCAEFGTTTRYQVCLNPPTVGASFALQ